MITCDHWPHSATVSIDHVILAECSRMTSMITPANSYAAVIVVNRRRDHKFVIIAPVLKITLFSDPIHNRNFTDTIKTWWDYRMQDNK